MAITGAANVSGAVSESVAGWVDYNGSSTLGEGHGGHFGFSNYTGNTTFGAGVVGQAGNEGTGTMATAAAFYGNVFRTSGTVTNGYGLYIDQVDATNPYGLYVSDAAAKNYLAGNVGIGTAIPKAILDVTATGTNSALIVPRDTTAARPAANVANGMIRYNTSTASFEGYANGAWGNLATATSGTASIPTVSVGSSYEGASSYVNTGTTYTISDTSVNIRRLTLTGNATITLPAFTTPTSGVYSITVFLKQDATGSRTIIFAGNGSDTIKWDTGTAPTISSTAGKITILQLMKPADETVWYGSMVWREN